MLPPDTYSSLVPWSMMIPVMQVTGCFPYRMSAKGGPPSFSLPLCLWAVFIVLFIIPVYCMAYRTISISFLSPEVGTIAFVYSCAVMFIVVGLLPLLLGMKSPELAALLHSLTVVERVTPKINHRWYCRPKSLAFVFIIILLVVLQTWHVTTTWKFVEFFDILSILITAVSYQVNLMLPHQLCFMIFDLLAHRLVEATETTVVTVSTLLAPNGSFKSEKDMESAMVALRDLDTITREVEVQRKKGTRCVFPVVTSYLLMAILEVIVCPYAILRGTIMVGITTAVLLTESYVMFSFCHVGQTFINEVIVAEELLKDLRIKSQNHLLTMKVNQVMGCLSSMLTFNMCGWYTLDHASFLMLVNTVLTYVVIIFQVGGNDFQNLLSPSSKQITASLSE